MAVHVAPLMLHVRGYVDGVDVAKPLCEMREPYLWHMVVLINDVGIARLEGLDAGISLRDLRALFNVLREFGVKRVEWRHKGIEKHIQMVK